MKEQFQLYLVNQGYSVKTPSGNPSTAYDYKKRIDKVCEWENLTWEELYHCIDRIVLLYDIGGTKEELGEKSHRAVINALKRFQEFASV